MKKPALSELTLTEKISQLLMIAQGQLLMTKELDDNGERIRRSYEEIDEIMEKCQYGSIWTGAGVVEANDHQDGFAYTFSLKGTAQQGKIETYNRWLKKVTKNVRIPVLAATNAERGLFGQFCDGTPTVAPFCVGAANDEKLTYDLSYGMGKEMRAAGIHWRWSPVSDLCNRYNGVSITRSFSQEPETLVRLCNAANRGVEAAKVASTMKHFPGADMYEIRDGHGSAPNLTMSFEEWEKTTGKVYQDIINAGVDTVMTSHVLFPAVDDTKINGKPLPATFSKKITTDLLRGKMGFKGVIVTDDINMGPMANYCSYEDGLIMAINAGNDILLGVSPEDYYIIEKAVLDGRIPMERIDESAQRVLDLKEKVGLFDDEEEVIDLEEAKKITTAANQAIADKCITLLYDRNNLLPLSKDKIKKVTIIYTSNEPETNDYLEVMKAEFEKRGAEVRYVTKLPVRKVHMEQFNADSDVIIFAALVDCHMPCGMPSLYNDAAKTYWWAFSAGKDKAIGVSLGYPYLHYDVMSGADTFVNIYSNAPIVQKSFVKALYGEIPFEGKSPVDLTPKLIQVWG